MAAALIAGFVAAPIACGGGGEETQTQARTQPQTATAVTQPATTTTVPNGPYGDLGTSRVGPVKVGMSAAQAEALFGKPPRKEEVNFGGGKAPQVDWVWKLEGSPFRLQFETKRNTVTGYSCRTSALKTRSGVRVGDRFSEVTRRYGKQLRESPVGTNAFLLSEGKPGTYPALTFGVTNGAIEEIAGGLFQPAGD